MWRGGTAYCQGDYVGWSAPLSDLSDWRCDGVIYRREQTPGNEEARKTMFAPDVVQGPDGRFYLYYGLSSAQAIYVAVCGTPTGQYQYYGAVRHPDGRLLTEYAPFDPAVLVDEGRIWLYYGFNARGNCVELEPDMVTVKGEPKLVLPGRDSAAGTPFQGHAFYEASSIRKIGGVYYLVYSSQVSHELCYATSSRPDGEFAYGGVLCSNGDIGYQGRLPEQRVTATGNNHGGLAQLNGQWYIFYHRHTHGTEYSRQGCAEPVELLPDGSIPMVEITSCGLNGGPLAGYERYGTYLACHLTGREGAGAVVYGGSAPGYPNIREEGLELPREQRRQYIADLTDGAVFGFKYLDFAQGVGGVSVTVRGTGAGALSVTLDGPEGRRLGAVPITPGGDWQEVCCPLETASGIHGGVLYLHRQRRAGGGGHSVPAGRIIIEHKAGEPPGDLAIYPLFFCGLGGSACPVLMNWRRKGTCSQKIHDYTFKIVLTSPNYCSSIEIQTIAIVWKGAVRYGNQTVRLGVKGDERPLAGGGQDRQGAFHHPERRHRLEPEHHLHRYQEVHRKRGHRPQRASFPVPCADFQGGGAGGGGGGADWQAVRRLRQPAVRRPPGAAEAVRRGAGPAAPAHRPAGSGGQG